MNELVDVTPLERPHEDEINFLKNIKTRIINELSLEKKDKEILLFFTNGKVQSVKLHA